MKFVFAHFSFKVGCSQICAARIFLLHSYANLLLGCFFMDWTIRKVRNGTVKPLVKKVLKAIIKMRLPREVVGRIRHRKQGENTLRKWMLSGILLIVAAPVFGQNADLSLLFDGKSLPQTKKLKDLDSEWRHISIGSMVKSEDNSSMMSQLMQLGMMGDKGKNGKGEDPMAAMLGMQMLSGLFGGSSEPVYYTQGRTINMGSETFLVTYRHKKKGMDFGALMGMAMANGGKEPDFEKMMTGDKVTEDTSLSLILLNTKAIASLSDIRPFDLEKEIAEANTSAGGGLMSLFMAGMKEGMQGGAAKAGEAATAVDTPVPPGEGVAMSVASSILSDPVMKGSKVSVDTSGIKVVGGEKGLAGSVTLRGTVKSAAQKQRAETLAKKAIASDGVSLTVKNALTVKL